MISSKIQEPVAKEVKKAKMFSILADETSDVTNVEQLSLVVCYVQDLSGGILMLKESFLGFSHAENLKGQDLSKQIIQLLTHWGLDSL